MGLRLSFVVVRCLGGRDDRNPNADNRDPQKQPGTEFLSEKERSCQRDKNRIQGFEGIDIAELESGK
jgi:hypothetical protein